MGQTRVLQMQDTFLRLCASTALVGALAFPVGAQQVINLEEITFSANLTPTGIAESGASVSVVAPTARETVGFPQAADILTRLPGVSVVQTGPVGTQADVRIRGAHPRYTQVFIDGIRVNDPSAVNAAFDFGPLMTGDIGRLEVLRGSQAARFGAGAVGGVVDISSRRPEDEGVSQRAYIETGSYRTLSLGYSLGVKTERGEISFNATRFQTRGFSAFDKNDGGHEADGFIGTRLGVAGRHAVTDNLVVGFAAFGQRSEIEYDGFGADADNEELRRQTGARAFAEYTVGTTTHVFDMTSYNIRRTNDFENFLGAREIDNFQGRRITASYLGTSEITSALALSYGLDVERETVRARPAGDFGVPYDSRERRWSVFSEANYRPTEGLNITANLRHENHSVFSGRTTGRVAFSWQVAEGLTLRGAAGTGYKIPDTAQRFGAFGNPNLQPENSRSAELGVDYSPFDGTGFAATAFWLGTTNEITFDPDTFVPLNLEKARRRGVELVASTAISEATIVSANYTYTNAVIKDGPSAGLRIGRVPRHDLTVTALTEFAERWRAEASLHAVTGRLDRNGSNPMPGFGVVNARISYEVNATTDLTLRVENVFNKQYQTVETYGTSDRAFYLGVASRF